MTFVIVKTPSLPEELQGIRSAPSVPKEEMILHDFAPPAQTLTPNQALRIQSSGSSYRTRD